MDTDVSGKSAASIFRFEMYRFRNTLGHMFKLLERGTKSRTRSETMGINGQKRVLSAVSKILLFSIMFPILF
jgi:hypothetical protein